MFIVNTPITFNYTRAKNASPNLLVVVRLSKPDGDIDEVPILTNTLPTGSTTGLLSFSFTPTIVGNHRIEILRGAAPHILAHTTIITVVSETTTYSTTLYV